MLVTHASAEKPLRRYLAARVLDHIPAGEDGAEALVAPADTFVRFQRMAVAIVRLRSSCFEKGGDREGEVGRGHREVAGEDLYRVGTTLGYKRDHLDGRYLFLQRPHVPEPQRVSVADEEVKVLREWVRAGGGSAYARVAESGERVFVVIMLAL
jgi:hypothetical protein